MADDDLTIPDFLRIPDEVRKAAWERNPPKSSSSHQLSAEQIAAAKARAQSESDRKRLQRCISKQRRANREAALDAKLEGKKAIAEGKTWDVRTARWIDPIEAAMQKEKTMVQAASNAETRMKTKRSKSKGADIADNIFGFRKETNYDRLMQYMLAHLNTMLPVRQLAEHAYDTSANLEKHIRRVVTMARKVQEKVITKKRMAYEIKKEKNDDGVCIGLFEK